MLKSVPHRQWKFTLRNTKNATVNFNIADTSPGGIIVKATLSSGTINPYGSAKVPLEVEVRNSMREG